MRQRRAEATEKEKQINTTRKVLMVELTFVMAKDRRAHVSD